MKRLDIYRQSTLRGSTICMRRTKADLMMPDDLSYGWSGHTADLGTAWHEYMAAYLATLAQQGEAQMPTQEAIEIMYEVLARLPFTLPFEALDDLRQMVLGFCFTKWDPAMLKGARFEEELRTEIVCPDGEVRVLKGTLDVRMFDPPAGLLVLDAKSGQARPRGPREEPEPGEVVEKRAYLSDLFQGDTYSLLAMREYPSARYVIFRETHLRSGQVRQGRLTREEVEEHVVRKLALTMMNLDRAISEGEESKLWRPRPGGHCNRQCPVTRSCPVPEEMRGEGAIASKERADEVAALYVVAKAQYTQAAAQLKSWEEGGNPPGQPNEAEAVRWGPDAEAFRTKGGGRKHGLWPAVVKVDDEKRAA